MALGIQWLHLIWVEKCVDFIWHSKGGSSQMKFEMASGCEWEWVATCCKNSKTSTSNGWETCRHNFSVIGAVVLSKTTSRHLKGGKKTTKMSDWDHQGHPKNSVSERSWEKKKQQTTAQQKNAETKKINYELRWPRTITILRSSDQRGRHRLDAPLPESATLSDMCVNGPIEYEWLDSVQRSQVHLLRRHAPASHRKKAPSSARGGREPGVRLEKTKKCVSHVRQSGWMSCVCLGACVTVSVWGWVRTRAETEGKKQTTKEA